MPSLPSLGWSRSQPSAPEKQVETEEEEDLDVPPPFPLPNSHQRSQAPPPSLPSSSTPTFSLAPPSPPREADEPPSDLNIAILPDATPIGNMAPPPSTTKRPEFGIQAEEKKEKKVKGRGKVALAPGCSALDWARLTSSGKDLKGTPPGFLRVTMDELKLVSQGAKSQVKLTPSTNPVKMPGRSSTERFTISLLTCHSTLEARMSLCVWRVGTGPSCSVSCRNPEHDWKLTFSVDAFVGQHGVHAARVHGGRPGSWLRGECCSQSAS